ncbi:hypothetical protein [Nocardia aurantiaca]|uniref:Pycsar effector protein domain-containing protein n=1 Tax=Nocardia aurantiaca TaxID=2675850 RepID=A0A6I3LC99_9NOCA|nr:hypothetical protein [Nocardia aurantiaca]MTE17459.1 hypothetical protein [Nocardia aurantiaca]
MNLAGQSGSRRGLSLEAVHWHLTREDTQRAAVSTRAGAVLSANALVVAGTALAFSLKGTRPLSLWVFGPAFCALVLVGGSVVCATQALVMLRSSERRFSQPRTAASTLYSLSRISREWPTFDEFRAAVVDQSIEQQLRGALDELWRHSHLHHFRYRKLRQGTWLLLLAIGMLLITVVSAALSY